MSEENLTTQIDENTLLVTSQKKAEKALEQAMYDFENKSNFHSVTFNETGNVTNFKISDIDLLASNLQSNLKNINQVNNIVRFFINKNDILGKVYEAIETNVNAQWNLSFPNYKEEEKEKFDEVEAIIKDFNEKIDLDRLIVESIPMTYLEGNYIVYLRKDINKDSFHVDYYPLGVAEVSDYSVSGEPYVLINIKELKSRLRKVYKKFKNNKSIFYKDMDDEVKNTYPKEVVQAYGDNEQYAKLDIEKTGLMRVNNMKRKYGVTPIFKSLKPVIRLENIELSDDRNTLVRGKKIIFQELNTELVTKHKDIPNITWNAGMAKAHNDLMLSLSQSGTSVYTGTPWTKDVRYIEPQLEQTNVQTKNQYRNQIMTSVGISFLSTDSGSYGASDISIKELMKMINRIGEQLARVLKKWYKGLLSDHGIEARFCPNIKILDTELLEQKLRLELASFMFDKMNTSHESVYEILGRDIKTEKMRRQYENENEYDKVFSPRLNAHTVSGKDASNNTGAPKSNEDKNKQDYDKTRNLENKVTTSQTGGELDE